MQLLIHAAVTATTRSRTLAPGEPYHAPPMSADRTLYLIDGHAQIFRSYYAIRGGMTSPVTGEPTHATFAFVGMLLKLFQQHRPTHGVMVIDRGGNGGREQLLPDYKATREPPPDDFKPQEQRILEIVELFGMPVLGHDVAEADDIIATLVREVRQAGEWNDAKVRLVTKDKDLEQLIGPRVELFDIHTDTTLDLAWLRETKGISPDQVVDLLALMGDKVDNIPGVDGIGPKTAAKLIGEYGSIDNLLDHLTEIKGKRRENLEKAKAFLPTAQQLVRLQSDIDTGFDLAASELQPIQGDRLLSLFSDLGFNRHQDDLKRLLDRDAGRDADRPPPVTFAEGLFAPADAADAPADAQPTARDADQYDYRLVATAQELDALIAELAGTDLLAVDTETQGRGPRSGLCGISLAIQPGAGWYIPTASCNVEQHLDQATVIEALRPVLEDERVGKVMHNAKFDLLVLRHAGLEVRGLASDTMVAGYLLSLPGLSLDDMAQSVLGHRMIPITDLIGAKGRGKTQKNMIDLPASDVAVYAAEDADATLRLHQTLLPRIDELGMRALLDDVEVPLVRVLADMEDAGIRVDPDVLDEQKDRLQARIDELLDAIRTAADEPLGFNPDSTKQLREVMFHKLHFPVVKRTKTGPSTDIEVLEKLSQRDDADLAEVPQHARKLPVLLVEYRQLTKLVGTYLGSLKEAIREDTGRVHASFNQTVTATGRLSSNDPNLQNIPIRTELGREVRRAFVAAPDHVLIAADYSQIELRVLAHLSDDPALLEAFREDRDIHAAVAAEVFDVPLDEVTREQRAQAKVVNFGIIYGVTAWGLARRIDGLDDAGAARLIEDYKARFTGIDRFLAQCVQHADQHGYVRTILGRRRLIEAIRDRHPQRRALGERLAINSVVQGSAADLIKVAMVDLHHVLATDHPDARLLLQIHDELVVECPEGQAESVTAAVVQSMQSAMELKVPLKVDVATGPDWYQAK
jgi:DNA polymerase-1